jgi:hypothetical protein
MLHITFRVPYDPETLMARPGRVPGSDPARARVGSVRSVTLDAE